jgi:hypothetical protein
MACQYVNTLGEILSKAFDQAVKDNDGRGKGTYIVAMDQIWKPIKRRTYSTLYQAVACIKTIRMAWSSPGWYLNGLNISHPVEEPSDVQFLQLKVWKKKDSALKRINKKGDKWLATKGLDWEISVKIFSKMDEKAKPVVKSFTGLIQEILLERHLGKGNSDEWPSFSFRYNASCHKATMPHGTIHVRQATEHLRVHESHCWGGKEFSHTQSMS